jgi:hypothetical protein
MKKRRGVGEILGSLMILIIVTSLGVVLLNLSMTTTISDQNQVLETTKTQEDVSQERFSILSINKKSNTEISIAYINYGKIDVTITDVYINSDHISLTNHVSSIKNEIKWINITNYNFLDYTEYRITIVSERGVSVDYNWRT